MKMDKQALIEAICQESGRTIGAVAYDLSLAYDVIFTAIVKAVVEDKVVEVPGFGRFCRIKNYFGSDQVSFTPDPHFIEEL
jgi:nucleoid DNA-binding protein